MEKTAAPANLSYAKSHVLCHTKKRQGQRQEEGEGQRQEEGEGD